MPPHHPIRTAKTEIPSCSLLPSSSLPPPSLLSPSPHLSSNQLPFSTSLSPEPLDLLDVILSRREGGEGRREGGGGGGRREGRGEEGGRGRGGGGGGRGGENGIKDWEVERVFENILMSSLDTMNLVFLWCLSFWIYLRVGFDVRVKGLGSLNIHTYSFAAGANSLKLPKGVCLVLGFVPQNQTIKNYDAGFSETGLKKEIDWLFE